MKYDDYRIIHRLVPHIHEDVVGFLARVAERNHMRGPAAMLANITEGSRRSIVATDLPRMAHYCRNYVEELLRLSGIEQRLSDGSRAWQIDGEWISKASFICATKVKVCPLCIQQNSFIRGIWSLSFYTACAQHRVRLIDRCPECRRPLQWHRRRIAHCGCDFSLATAPVVPATSSSVLISQLIANRNLTGIDLEESHPHVREIERLARLSLDGLCKTIWFLGHCIAELHQFGAGHGRLQPNLEEAEGMVNRAVDLLNNWPERLGDQLRVSCTAVPSRTSSALLDRLLGPVQYYLHEELQADELSFVRSAYEQHIRMLWRTFGRSHRLRNAERQFEIEFD